MAIGVGEVEQIAGERGEVLLQGHQIDHLDLGIGEEGRSRQFRLCLLKDQEGRYRKSAGRRTLSRQPARDVRRPMARSSPVSEDLVPRHFAALRGLEGFDVFNSVSDCAADAHEGRTLLQPSPALKRASARGSIAGPAELD